MGADLRTSFRVSPPLLMKWLPPHELKRSMVLLDLRPDCLDEHTTRLDLNVAFRAVDLVPEGSQEIGRYLMGCIAAQIIVTTLDGQVIDNTQSQTLKTTRRVKQSTLRNSTVTLKPEIGVKGASTEYSASLGELTYERGRTDEQELEFECTERTLSAVNTAGMMEWRFDPPRGEAAVRDFIHGNLLLYATCAWPAGRRRGKVEVRPTRCEIFGQDGRQITGVREIAVRFLLRGVLENVLRREGLTVAFEEDG